MQWAVSRLRGRLLPAKLIFCMQGGVWDGSMDFYNAVAEDMKTENSALWYKKDVLTYLVLASKLVGEIVIQLGKPAGSQVSKVG